MLKIKKIPISTPNSNNNNNNIFLNSKLEASQNINKTTNKDFSKDFNSKNTISNSISITPKDSKHVKSEIIYNVVNSSNMSNLNNYNSNNSNSNTNNKTIDNSNSRTVNPNNKFKNVNSVNNLNNNVNVNKNENDYIKIDNDFITSSSSIYKPILNSSSINNFKLKNYNQSYISNQSKASSLSKSVKINILNLSENKINKNKFEKSDSQQKFSTNSPSKNNTNETIESGLNSIEIDTGENRTTVIAYDKNKPILDKRVEDDKKRNKIFNLTVSNNLNGLSTGNINQNSKTIDVNSLQNNNIISKNTSLSNNNQTNNNNYSTINNSNNFSKGSNFNNNLSDVKKQIFSMFNSSNQSNMQSSSVISNQIPINITKHNSQENKQLNSFLYPKERSENNSNSNLKNQYVLNNDLRVDKVENLSNYIKVASKTTKATAKSSISYNLESTKTLKNIYSTSFINYLKDIKSISLKNYSLFKSLKQVEIQINSNNLNKGKSDVKKSKLNILENFHILSIFKNWRNFTNKNSYFKKRINLSKFHLLKDDEFSINYISAINEFSNKPINEYLFSKEIKLKKDRNIMKELNFDNLFNDFKIFKEKAVNEILITLKRAFDNISVLRNSLKLTIEKISLNNSTPNSIKKKISNNNFNLPHSNTNISINSNNSNNMINTTNISYLLNNFNNLVKNIHIHTIFQIFNISLELSNIIQEIYFTKNKALFTLLFEISLKDGSIFTDHDDKIKRLEELLQGFLNDLFAKNSILSKFKEMYENNNVFINSLASNTSSNLQNIQNSTLSSLNMNIKKLSFYKYENLFSFYKANILMNIKNKILKKIKIILDVNIKEISNPNNIKEISDLIKFKCNFFRLEELRGKIDKLESDCKNNSDKSLENNLRMFKNLSEINSLSSDVKNTKLNFENLHFNAYQYISIIESRINILNKTVFKNLSDVINSEFKIVDKSSTIISKLYLNLDYVDCKDLIDKQKLTSSLSPSFIHEKIINKEKEDGFNDSNSNEFQIINNEINTFKLFEKFLVLEINKINLNFLKNIEDRFIKFKTELISNNLYNSLELYSNKESKSSLYLLKIEISNIVIKSVELEEKIIDSINSLIINDNNQNSMSSINIKKDITSENEIELSLKNKSQLYNYDMILVNILEEISHLLTYKSHNNDMLFLIKVKFFNIFEILKLQGFNINHEFSIIFSVSEMIYETTESKLKLNKLIKKNCTIHIPNQELEELKTKCKLKRDFYDSFYDNLSKNLSCFKEILNKEGLERNSVDFNKYEQYSDVQSYFKLNFFDFDFKKDNVENLIPFNYEISDFQILNKQVQIMLGNKSFFTTKYVAKALISYKNLLDKFESTDKTNENELKLKDIIYKDILKIIYLFNENENEKYDQNDFLNSLNDENNTNTNCEIYPNKLIKELTSKEDLENYLCSIIIENINIFSNKNVDINGIFECIVKLDFKINRFQAYTSNLLDNNVLKAQNQISKYLENNINFTNLMKSLIELMSLLLDTIGLFKDYIKNKKMTTLIKQYLNKGKKNLTEETVNEEFIYGTIILYLSAILRDAKDKVIFKISVDLILNINKFSKALNQISKQLISVNQLKESYLKRIKEKYTKMLFILNEIDSANYGMIEFLEWNLSMMNNSQISSINNNNNIKIQSVNSKNKSIEINKGITHDDIVNINYYYHKMNNHYITFSKIDSMYYVIGVHHTQYNYLIFKNKICVNRCLYITNDCQNDVLNLYNLITCEISNSIKSEIMNSLTNFPKLNFFDWIFSNTQQVTICDIELILNNEISQILLNYSNNESTSSDDSDKKNDSSILNRAEKLKKIKKKKTIVEEGRIIKEDLESLFNKYQTWIETLVNRVFKVKYDEDNNNVNNSNKSEIGTYLKHADLIDTFYNTFFHSNITYQNSKEDSILLKIKKDKDKDIQLQNKKSLNFIKYIHSNYQNILMILINHRNILQQLILGNVVDIESYDWLKYIRNLWDDEKKEVLVECGGWSLYKQYNYVNNMKIILTPQTEKIFLFTASCFRERSAAIIKTTFNNFSYYHIFEEFANNFWINVVKVNFEENYIKFNTINERVKHLFDASSISNSWIFFENFDSLSTERVLAISKLMQIIQQEIILNEIKPDNNDGSISKTFCLFGSIKLDSSAKIKESYLKSSCRLMNLVKPDSGYFIKNLVEYIGIIGNNITSSFETEIVSKHVGIIVTKSNKIISDKKGDNNYYNNLFKEFLSDQPQDNIMNQKKSNISIKSNAKKEFCYSTSELIKRLCFILFNTAEKLIISKNGNFYFEFYSLHLIHLYFNSLINEKHLEKNHQENENIKSDLFNGYSFISSSFPVFRHFLEFIIDYLKNLNYFSDDELINYFYINVKQNINSLEEDSTFLNLDLNWIKEEIKAAFKFNNSKQKSKKVKENDKLTKFINSFKKTYEDNFYILTDNILRSAQTLFSNISKGFTKIPVIYGDRMCGKSVFISSFISGLNGNEIKAKNLEKEIIKQINLSIENRMNNYDPYYSFFIFERLKSLENTRYIKEIKPLLFKYLMNQNNIFALIELDNLASFSHHDITFYQLIKIDYPNNNVSCNSSMSNIKSSNINLNQKINVNNFSDDNNISVSNEYTNKVLCKKQVIKSFMSRINQVLKLKNITLSDECFFCFIEFIFALLKGVCNIFCESNLDYDEKKEEFELDNFFHQFSTELFNFISTFCFDDNLLNFIDNKGLKEYVFFNIVIECFILSFYSKSLKFKELNTDSLKFKSHNANANVRFINI
jgi:hypothetical protein